MGGLEERQKEFAEKHRITYDEYKRLVTTLQYEEIITCLELLKPAKHNSEYRQKMEDQVRAWFTGALLTTKPLTPRQFAVLRPKWPVRYNLPT